MKVTRSRRYTINMGNYESYHFGAEITVSNYDVGLTDDQVAGLDEAAFEGIAETLEELALNWLHNLLLEEVQDTASLTPDRKTFLLRALQPERKATANARGQSKTRRS